jgi:putative redox protein
LATERITFPGASGDQLAARIELPASGRPRAWALFAHCFTCSKNFRAAVEITRALSRLGFAVVRFDFTGLGESEGDFADTNFSSNVDDLLAAGRFMEESYDAPALLVGHSLGGAAVLQAAAALPSVRAVATIGAPADPGHVLQHVSSAIEEIERDGEAEVTIAGRPFRVRKQFLDDLDGRNMERVVSDLGRALVIFHSPIDEIVGIDNAARLYAMARHPKSFVSLDRADHLLTDPADARYVASVLGAWASRYVEAAPEMTISELAESDRAVTRTRTGTFYTDIAIREHSLVGDEPKSVGGEDLGPTPYDYLLAGLGSCTSMTLQMYAGRKEWPLEEAVVRLRHKKVHAQDSADPDGSHPRLDHIEREVELIGPLDDAQRARLFEIADRCPVHRTLERGAHVHTAARTDHGG